MSLGFTSKEHQDNYERNVRESIWEGTIRDAIPRLEALAEQMHQNPGHDRASPWEGCSQYGCVVIQRMIRDFKRTMGPGR